MALDFPFGAYIEAKQRAEQRRQQMAQGWGQTLASLGQSAGVGIKNFEARKKKKEDEAKMKSAVDALVQQNPSLAPYGEVFKRQPELMGQILPGITKQKPPSVSLFRNTETNEVSMKPQTGPNWIEETGLTPQQRETSLNSAESAKSRKVWSDAVKQRTEYGIVQNIYNDLNSLNKTSGGVLGQAAVIQYRSQRGDHLLNTPGIANDKLVFNLVKADLASIAQGGSPTLAAQAEANEPTFKETAAGLLRRITANPKDIDQPQIRQQLRKIFQVMNASAGQIINQNTEGVRALYEDSGFVKDHPQAFERAIQYLGQGIKPFDTTKLPILPDNLAPTWENTQPADEGNQ